MASTNSHPNTKVSKRADIFNNFSDDQVDQPIDMDASKRMEAMMNMVLVEETMEEEPANNDDQETSMDEEEEDAFAFRLFSTDTVAKVSIKENHEETANALSQQIANQQQIDHDETDPTFLANIAQASISYDDIMQQSTWAYPALRLPKRVTYLPSASALASSSIPKVDGSTSSTDKSKRKSKKRRDYEKAVKEGRITPKPNMRDPRTPGGWPGYPGARDPYAIINTQPYRGNRRTGGSGGGTGGFKGNHQGSGPQRSFGSGRGRGGGFGVRGRGRGAGTNTSGPSRFKKPVAV